MNELNEFNILIIIASSFVFGGVLGACSMLFINKGLIEDLNEEIDKFRELYFNEVDRWNDKYIDTDPDNNLEP